MAIKFISKLCMIFLAFAFLMQFASANNCTPLYVTGDSQYRADIVIVGHGWAQSDLGDFYTDTKFIADYLFTYPAYSNYSRMFNIWYVNQSADLGCSFPGGGNPSCDYSASMALASQCPYDKVYVFINDSLYGGSSSTTIAYGSRHPTLKEETFVHEIGGHAMGELMDEYSYGGTGNLYFSGANCATAAEANWVDNAIPCTKWENVSNTGCYLNCSYINLYRPSSTSIMRSTASKYFNGPSQNQIAKVADKWANLTSDYNPKTPQTLESYENASLSITKVNASDPVTIQWYVSGSEQTSAINQTDFTFIPSSGGNFIIEAKASFLDMNESYSWNITVNAPADPVEILSWAPVAENITMDENSSQAFTVTANGTAPVYSWKLDSLEQSTAQNWTYNTGFSSAGSRNITVVVSNGVSQTSHSWNVTVNNINRAPTISSSPLTTGQENQLYKYNIIASDPDSDSLSYYLETYPAGMNVNSTGTISWTPSTQGTYHVKAIASDGNLNATQEYDINVTYENHLPTLDDVSDQVVNENQLLKFNLTGNDADLVNGDSLTYYADELLTVNKINDTLAEVSWTPGYNDADEYYLGIAVEDSFGEMDIKQVKITVNNVNRAPALNSISDKSVVVDNQIKFNVSASDADGDTIIYSTNMTELSVNKINNNLAEISWTPNTPGIFYAEVTASDGNLSDMKVVKITVSDVNHAPVLNAVSDQVVNENQELKFNISASDVDGNTLTYFANSTLSVNKLNNNLAEVSWTPGYNNAGVHYFNLTSSDGSLSDSKIVKITVNNVNRAPALNSISDKSVQVNSELKFNITATDADLDTLTYSANSSLSVNKINNTLAEISWTPTIEGIYYFNLTASDGSLSDSKIVKITVDAEPVTNHAPVLNSIADITVYEGDTVTITPSATDEDNNSIIYYFSGWMESNSKATDYNSAGNFTVNVTASDGMLSDSKIVNVNVLNSYKIIMAVSDKVTRARLTGTVDIDGSGKQTTPSATATFENVHAGTHAIAYSSSGYKTNSNTATFENGLAECALGSDCALSATSCKWNNAYSDFTCTNGNFIFVYNPAQSAVKRIDYLGK